MANNWPIFVLLEDQRPACSQNNGLDHYQPSERKAAEDKGTSLAFRFRSDVPVVVAAEKARPPPSGKGIDARMFKSRVEDWVHKLESSAVV
ncbi:hypothetical protein NL676_000755 [Syzygium grande]|nr:hypothetical protein NL676_000755 [Syzygium grande]